MSTDEQDEKDVTLSKDSKATGADSKEAVKPRTGRSPMDKVAKDRPPLPLPLIVAAVAVVLALIACGVAGWSVYALNQATQEPVSDSNEQNSARVTVCDATIMVRKGIAVNANLQLPDGDNEQIGALLRGANSRVALVTGAEYLQSKLTPAVPADLTDAVQKFSNVLLEIGAAAAVGTLNDDPEQANRLHDADTYAALINDICSK